jgi:CDP-paratose 2-epimerase
VVHGDVRCRSDLDGLPEVDWVIDAAANPSVLAGVDGASTSRQLLEHNLSGTINLLELCKRHEAGLVLLSTSRVYSIEPLAALRTTTRDQAFELDPEQDLPQGLGVDGIQESFSTEPPLSLYGVTKRASELLALEYGAAFGLPVWINRCGVLAGAGQFGRPDQGIFSFWIHSHLRRRPLRYIGFEGTGAQVRDALHPADLVPLISRQMSTVPAEAPQIINLGGGRANSMSLAQLTAWCDERLGPHPVQSTSESRPFDLPWVVMDCSLAREVWGWAPATSLDEILEEIAGHAEANPEWLDVSRGCAR